MTTVSDTVPLTLPAMGESVSEGTVARWLKAVGDDVAAGEPIVEVTTDKVDVEVPAPATGRLAEIMANEGDTIAVGATLGTIAAGVAADTPRPTATAPVPPAAAAPKPTPKPVTAATAPTVGAEPAVPVAPLARRTAALAGVDLAGVQGSGPGGAISRGDVLHRPGAVDTTPGVPEGAATTPLRGPAATLVDYMEQSRGIPTATSFRVLPVALLDARRRELNSSLQTSGKALKVSFTHLIGHAIARAAHEMPIMAASFARDSAGKPVRVDNVVHLGLAVDSRRKDGSRFLVVPVIRDAGTLSFAAFHAEYERLIARARTNELVPDELRGASLTLTNPGGIGTVASVPRLMPGQGTILATGAIGLPAEWRATPAATIAQLGVAKVMTMTSTYDHRVIQGAESGDFLARVDALLSGADGFYNAVFASLGLAAPTADPVPPTMTAASTAAATPAGAAVVDRSLLAAMQAATSLVKAHRTHGHLGAHLDPLGSQPVGDPAMEPTTYGLTPEIMKQVPADLLRVYVAGETLLDVLPNLRDRYCGSIAYEIEHISSHEQRVWLREHIESGRFRRELSKADKVTLLRRLTRGDALERYLRRTFIGQKTYSGEGLDAVVPMLEALINMVSADGINELVLGMAHRGRLNVLAHVANQPYETVLSAFEKNHQRRAVGVTVDDPTGDVKYHLGATGTYVTDSGKATSVRLLPNPSHLEAVDGVVEGWVRAEQTRRDGPEAHVDPRAAIPVLLHGDAAFMGQGLVAEVLNMQSLAGYATGGTVHIITNNQIGFTTDPRDDRSTRYASDLAKGFDIPIIHVNADDLDACIHAVSLAYDYRRTYHRDVLIDLIGYRRWGHNETDEPSYTQPVMYQRIKAHPTVREIFARHCVETGLLTQAEADAMESEAQTAISDAHKRVKEVLTQTPDDRPANARNAIPDVDEARIDTTVSADRLKALNEQLLSAPEGFHVNPKLLKQWVRRRESLENGGIEWGTAEALAFASLLTEGHAIRLTGQDTQRGTFSQRHVALHDDVDGSVYIPMQHLIGATAPFEVYNSPLSEVGTLSFEYGYSAAAPDVFVLWEAQFGDFVNNAQMVIDQFIASALAKWGQRSRLTLLLPHGYEGQGPEHSSARVERFLQMAAHGNMRVANCSTAAQYFHLMRNQALSPTPRPLVVMTPKSLLRAPAASVELSDLAKGRFQPVIDDPLVAKNRHDVTTLLLCTGKIYHELAAHPLRERATDLAVVRVELLDPIPMEELLTLVRAYPHLEQIFWVQEEPANMGAWPHMSRPIGQRRPYELRWDYIGRPRRASPSEGYSGSHAVEQERIIVEALSKSRAVQRMPGGVPSQGNDDAPTPAAPGPKPAPKAKAKR